MLAFGFVLLAIFSFVQNCFAQSNVTDFCGPGTFFDPRTNRCEVPPPASGPSVSFPSLQTSASGTLKILANGVIIQNMSAPPSQAPLDLFAFVTSVLGQLGSIQNSVVALQDAVRLLQNGQTTLNSQVSGLQGGQASINASLQNTISDLKSLTNTLNNSIVQESSRASTTELSLATNIGQQVLQTSSQATATSASLARSVQQVQTTLTTQTTQIVFNLTQETSRALAAEQGLTSSISSETTRALSVEGQLSSGVRATQSSLTATINQLVQLNANQTNLFNAHNTTRNFTDVAIQNIALEVARATAVDIALQSQLTVETNRATAAEAALGALLSIEVSRAMAAEQLLLPKATAASTYLTVSNAAATYLSSNTATSTYLTQSSAAATYLTQNTATTTYASISNVNANFLTQSAASSTYLTQSSAAATYATQSNVVATYLPISTASTTYLTITNAAATYLNKAPGTIMVFAAATAPAGWILCDGSAFAIGNPTYAVLYGVIGFTYTTTANRNVNLFQVPDLRGRVPRGQDSTGANGYTVALGAAGGQTQTSFSISVAQLPSHTHTGSGTTSSANARFYRTVSASPGGTNSAANHQPGWTGGAFTDRNDNQVLIFCDRASVCMSLSVAVAFCACAGVCCFVVPDYLWFQLRSLRVRQ